MRRSSGPRHRRTPVWRASGVLFLALLTCAASAVTAAQTAVADGAGAGRVATSGRTGTGGTVSATPPTAPVACPGGPATPIAGLPRMALPCLTAPGTVVTLGDLYGRPMVLNLWASWCGPCRHEAPVLRDAHRATGARVTFLGVDSRDEQAAAIRMLAATGVDYPQASDPPGAFATRSGVPGLPYTLVVDGAGHVVARRAGEITAGWLRDALRRAGTTPG